MIYIPEQWLNDRGNEKEILSLLEKNAGCFKFEKNTDRSREVEARLVELGEYKILKEFKNGVFALS